MTTPPIRVAIVEDDRTLREGLAALIDGAGGFRCRQTFGSVEAAASAARSGLLETPDVLFLDIGLPGIQGTLGAALFRELLPSTAIVMFTVYDDHDRIFEALCNGAAGYLLKRTRPERILEAIRDARDGGSPMSPEIARRVVDQFRRPPSPKTATGSDTPAPALSDGERRVLKLLVEGHSYQECADALEISVNTVRNYIRTIYDKLHVHSKSAAVARALRERLV
jgi:DNA-binding NarL/FixJ family response regulator